MRFIRPQDVLQIQLPAAWNANVQAAEAATAALANADRKQRNQCMNGFAADTWSAVKPQLAALNSGKCWYCDCRQDRADNTVDHFRPKGRVIGCPAHSGYWWLAFRLNNFRYSCTFCNSRRTDQETGRSGGKHDHFPVFPPFRQMAPGEEWQNEEPILLDPTNDQDIGLLTWKVDGTPDARYDRAVHARWWEKATTSIRIYHLDHSKLNQFRRSIYSDIHLHVNDGDIYFKKALGGDGTAEHALGRVKRFLIDLTTDKAQCRESARQYLSEFRTPDRMWLQAIP